MLKVLDRVADMIRWAFVSMMVVLIQLAAVAAAMLYRFRDFEVPLALSVVMFGIVPFMGFAGLYFRRGFFFKQRRSRSGNFGVLVGLFTGLSLALHGAVTGWAHEPPWIAVLDFFIVPIAGVIALVFGLVKFELFDELD